MSTNTVSGGTGVLQLWEDVMRYGGTKEKLLAVAFMNVSAGFDSVPHSQPHRKIQGAFRTEALESF